MQSMIEEVSIDEARIAVRDMAIITRALDWCRENHATLKVVPQKTGGWHCIIERWDGGGAHMADDTFPEVIRRAHCTMKERE